MIFINNNKMDTELRQQFLKYYNNEMTLEEKEGFNDRLKFNSDLKAQFDDFSIAMIAGERIHYNEVKLNIDRITGEESKRFKLRRLLSYAASGILLIALISFVIYLNKGQSPEAIYASYYEAPPYSPSRNVDGAVDKLRVAELKFAEENWTEAINNINDLDSVPYNDLYTQRILAHSYLNNGETLAAIQTFSLISTKSKDKFQLEDYWFLALSNLKNGDLMNAMIYLNLITDSELTSRYKKDAIEIKSKLD